MDRDKELKSHLDFLMHKLWKGKIMLRKKLLWIASAILLVFAGNAVAADKSFTFGILMVGPYNDHGWSQAHHEAGQYIEKKIPGAKMIYIDKVNPADRPGVTIPQLVDDMVEKGAKFIVANSDDMKDGVREAAKMHPDVYFLHISGDDVMTGKAPKNLSNLMGKMEYGAMMAGFSAAMTTKTGKIGYLGPLVNEETRRLASACYLGAKYAWENVLKKNPKDLSFDVKWIGFWFNIPGVTADPTQVSQNFFSSGSDVVISGIDTTEALTVANQKRKEGKQAWAIPYDFKGACASAPESCIGVPYYNWGPKMLYFAEMAIKGTWKQEWIWAGPDWANINNPETSTIGYAGGAALSPEASKALDKFTKDLGAGTVDLFKGPLNFQDGTVFLKDGDKAEDKKLWYMPQMLQGMTGQSSAK